MTRIGVPENGTQLQMALLRAAKDLGFAAQMTRRSHLCRTESTSGFPDLLLAVRNVTVFIECKSKYERVSPEQIEWAVALGFASVALGATYSFQRWESGRERIIRSYYLARPADYDRIISDLHRMAEGDLRP